MLILIHLFSSPEKTASTPKSFTAKPAESSLSSYSFPVTILMTQPEYVHNMYKICLRFPPVEIYTPTYVSPNMHMTCLLLAQDTQVKIVSVSDLLVIIVQSGSGALAPVTGFLGK